MRVYIAGPMARKPYFNVAAFDSAAELGRTLGHQIVNPAEHDREMGLDVSQYPTGDIVQLLADKPGFMDGVMEWDLRQVLTSDAVALLPGWEASKGACAEAAVATWAQKQILDAATFEPFPPAPAEPKIRKFASGATRDSDATKLDFEGFLDPAVLFAFSEYMSKHRRMADGSLRDSDNWQRGIPRAVLVKSFLRHAFELWRAHRGHPLTPATERDPQSLLEICCALLFNVQAYMRELLLDRDTGSGQEVA